MHRASFFTLIWAASAASAACEADDARHGAPANAPNDAPGGRGGSTYAGAGGGAEAGRSSGVGGSGTSGGGEGGTGTGSGGTGRPGGASGHGAIGGSVEAGTGPGEPAGQGGESGEGGDPAGGAGGEGGGPGDDKQEFVYVSRLLGGVLSLSLDPTSGAPRELESSPTNSGRFLYAAATDQAKRFLFTLEPDPGHVDTYRIADDGTIPKSPSSSLSSDAQPITFAVAPDGHFLYVGMLEGQSIHALAIDSDTGALTAAAAPLALPTPPAYLAIDPTGRFLYESQEFVPGIRGYRIGATGALTELDESPFGEALVRQGAIVFAPDGAFLFSSGNGLNAFAIDPTSGELDAVEGSPFSVDIGSDFFATNIAIDPRGDFLYTTSFLATNHVRGFSIDPASGALEEVPGSPLTTSSPYSLAVDPAGRFVYVGNDSGDTSVFSIDRRDGSLDEVEESPFPLGGLQPGFAFATR